MNRILRGGIFRLIFALALALAAGLSGCGTGTASPAASDGQALSCTLSVSCAAALSSDQISDELAARLPKDGWIYTAETVSFTPGETVLALLREAAGAAGIPVDVTQAGGLAYVRGIGNLYEKDCGSLSGWLYKVNGEILSTSAGDCVLKDGDRVEWVYSCDLGRDMGWS